MENTREMELIDANQLTSGRNILKNTVINLFGQLIPILVALAAIPLLIKGLGTEKFGLLNLAWLIIGYFSFFDFGLGRALTQLVADLLGEKRQNDIPVYVWTALFVMTFLGLIGTLIVIFLTPILVKKIFLIPQGFQFETINSFYILSICIPIVVSTAALRGVLEAQQRFDLVNYLRVPMGIFNYIGPLLVLPFTNGLFYVVVVLALGRLAAWFAHLILVLKTFPILRVRITLHLSVLPPLIRNGGWMTVSSIVGPFLIYMDRFLISAVVSAAAVAYYATPYEMVNKLTVIPSALVNVLFPAFAVSYIRDRYRALVLLDQGVRVIFLFLFPITLVIVVLAQEGMRLWLGQDFAQNSWRVLQVLAIGVLMNNLASMPYTFVQGIGRPDIAAKLHLIELPIYIFLLWRLLLVYGIVGAAIAWMIRTTLDMCLMYIATFRLIHLEFNLVWRITFMIGTGMMVLLFGLFPLDLNLRLVLLTITLFIFALVSWLKLLSSTEKGLAKSWIKMFPKISKF